MSASSPERLAEWISASPEARSRALAKCLETIALKDPRIHAWVQINPQSATETGPLSGIPFGAKDIIDTRGLVTEYGSAIYRGRVGVEDADIIAAELRNSTGACSVRPGSWARRATPEGARIATAQTVRVTQARRGKRCNIPNSNS